MRIISHQGNPNTEAYTVNYCNSLTRPRDIYHIDMDNVILISLKFSPHIKKTFINEASAFVRVVTEFVEETKE